MIGRALGFLGFLVIVAIALAAIALAAAAAFQRQLQYFPSRTDSEGKGNAIFRPWRDAAGIFWGYVRESSAPRRVVLFFHGNGGEALDRSWVGQWLEDPALAIVLVEYPGYGAKGGTPTEETLYRDAEMAFDRAKREWIGLPITVVGESLGSAVAAYLSAKRPVDRLALIAPLSSAVDVGQKHYPYLPVRWLLIDRFPASEHVRTAQAPLFVVHGSQDEVVPLELGKRVFEAYPSSQKTFLELPGTGHNDIANAILAAPSAKAFKAFVSGL